MDSGAYRKMVTDLSDVNSKTFQAITDLESAISWEKDNVNKSILENVLHKLDTNSKKLDGLIEVVDGWCKETAKDSGEQIGFLDN